MTTTTTTTHSLNVPHVHLSPSTPPAYLRRLIIHSLHRRGLDGAEAGVIAEMERLLEQHVQGLFESAREYAELASRGAPNAEDLLMAHSESSHGVKQLKRESRKRRRAIRLETMQDPVEDPLRETLVSLAETMAADSASRLNGLDGSLPADDDDVGKGDGDWKGHAGRKLEHAFEGAPGLPPRWTFPSRPREAEIPPPAKVTSAALDFVKATVAEADVNPDLGIVNYRKRAKR